jgi:hypothetical protein
MVLLSGCGSPGFNLLDSKEAYQFHTGETAKVVNPATGMDKEPDAAKTPSPAELPRAGATPPASAQEARKIIYDGHFVVAVSDLPQAQDRLKTMTSEMGGYLQSLSDEEVVVRVPSARFDEAVHSLARLGTILQRQIKAQDVTDVVTDLRMRLDNAKALKEKVQALLEKAGTLQATVEMEKELARLALEIERLEGALAKIDNQITFGTLTVTFRSPGNYPQINPQLPFDWLRGVGLEQLMQFKGKNLY